MNKDRLLHLLESSALTYKDQQSIPEDGVLCQVDDVPSGTQYVIYKDGDTMTIVFRGTDSFGDVIHDLQFFKKEIPYGNTSSKIRVHTGFLHMYKSRGVRDRIHSHMSDRIRQVFVAGHSLGAALAVLCAVDLQYNFPWCDFEVYLYGCPRVGNRAFADSYNKRLFKTLRVENGNDIVTKLPFAWMGYRHVGIRLHVGAPRISLCYVHADHDLKRYYAHLFNQFQP